MQSLFQILQHWVTGGNDSISSDNSKCFTKIKVDMGKYCKDDEIVSNICDGSEDDCVTKGEDYCWSRSDCHGIMFSDVWASTNFGVKLCKSVTLTDDPYLEWTIFLKCSKSKYVIEIVITMRGK